MAKVNATDFDSTKNADGFDIAAGTTKRKLTVTAGDVTVTGGNANTYTMPSVSCTLAANSRQFAGTADDSATNIATLTSIIPTGQGSSTLSANAFSAGITVRVTAMGRYSHTSSQKLELYLKLGSTYVISSGTFSLGAGSQTDNFWELNALLTCRTAGATGTIQTQGNFKLMDAGNSPYCLPYDGRTGTDTIDTTGTLAIDILADWNTADVNNSITLTNLLIEVIR